MVVSSPREYHPYALCLWQLRTREGKKLPLTKRQVQVLQALADGEGTDDAAVLIGIGWETLRTHLKHAKKALGAHTQAHAIALAMRKGLIR